MKSALFIGRFQPFHKGHLDVIEEILKTSDRVIIVIGSAENNYVTSNPLTASERFQIIDLALKEAKIPATKYCIIPIRNVNNYSLWVNHVNSYVPPYQYLYTGSKVVKACYLGKYFQSKSTKTGPKIIQLKRKFGISATKIRTLMIKNRNWQKFVPLAVAKKLEEWEIPARLRTIQETMDTSKYFSSY